MAEPFLCQPILPPGRAGSKQANYFIQEKLCNVFLVWTWIQSMCALSRIGTRRLPQLPGIQPAKTNLHCDRFWPKKAQRVQTYQVLLTGTVCSRDYCRVGPRRLTTVLYYILEQSHYHMPSSGEWKCDDRVRLISSYAVNSVIGAWFNPWVCSYRLGCVGVWWGSGGRVKCARKGNVFGQGVM